MEKAFCCAPDFPVVQTNYGPVRGYRFREISSFKGIPYGRAVRFHAPQPPQPWAEPLDASSYGCVCPLLSIDKPSGELRVPHRYWVQDEDCLNLNIWTPACDAQKRPVMVWLHGGGFFAGSSIEQVAYEGGNMAREGDCVVVSLNHRLNILGYLDLSDFGEEYANSGNAGGDDIILALQWVRDNIAAFGGDPGCVTVFGQSGGGAKVTTLLQTPAADGLYHRAMIMSGVLEGLLNDSVGSGRDCVQALMQELGVQTAQQLETVPYHQLAQAYRNVSPALKAKGANVGQSPHPNRFYLGDPLQNGSGFRPETANVPVLIGTVYSEFYGFFDGLKGVGPEEAVGLSAAETLREQFRTAYPHRPEEDLLLADTSFRAPTIKYVRERAKAGGKVYSYLFDQDFPLMGKSTPWHCADIPFVFHNTELVPVCAFEGAKQLEAEIFGAVMQFARTGAPGWAASTEDVEQTMLFGPQSRLVQNHDHALIEALAPFTDLRMKKATRAGGQIQIGTVYSEFYGFFDGLKGVGPEEAVGLSAAETLREQFRTAYPHRPEEDLLLADTSFRAPTIKYVRERAKAGGKVYSYLFDQDFPLMGKSTPWHCADIPFVFHNTELVPVCAFEGAKQLEAEIFGAVMQFARTGAPGWAASTEDVEQTMLFGPQSRLVQNHDHALIEALAPFTDLRMKKATRAGGQIQH